MGGVDMPQVLPNGTPCEVRGEVRRRFKDCGRGPRYVVASVHVIPPDAQPENVCALDEEPLTASRFPLAL